ncbi:MAG: hypothetical protein V7720_13950 [Halioglobus sp.]
MSILGRVLPITFASLMVAVGSAWADDLESAATDLCEKIKYCSMAQIADADMTPEMRQMMEPMFQSMCDAMRSGVQEVPTGHQLHDPALSCMRSMAELGCDDFQDEQKVETQACKDYQQKAEQLGQGS